MVWQGIYVPIRANKILKGGSLLLWIPGCKVQIGFNNAEHIIRFCFMHCCNRFWSHKDVITMQNTQQKYLQSLFSNMLKSKKEMECVTFQKLKLVSLKKLRKDFYDGR